MSSQTSFGIVLTLNPYSQNLNEDGHSYSVPYYFIRKDNDVDGWYPLEKEEPLKTGQKYTFYVYDLSIDEAPQGLELTVQFAKEQPPQTTPDWTSVVSTAAPIKGSPFDKETTDELENAAPPTATGVSKLVGIGTGKFGYGRFGPFELVNEGSFTLNLFPGYKTQARRYKVDPHMDVGSGGN